MKRLLILLFVLVNLSAFGQTTVTADRVVANRGFYLKDRWVDSIGVDTVMQGEIRSLPSSDAVYRLVHGRLTNLSIPYSAITGKPNLVLQATLDDSTSVLRDSINALRADIGSGGGGASPSIDSFTYATRRYVDSLAVPKSRTITIAGVTQDLSSDASFSPYHFVYSLEGLGAGDGMYVSLKNDAANPGTDRYYGTDSNGTKGWHLLGTASGGGGASTTLSTLTYGATTTWDYSTQGTAAKVTLTGNTTLSITNLPASVTYLTLEVVQDATGSRTITLPAGTKVIGGGAGAVTLTTTGGATDILTFYYNGTTLYCNIGTNYN